MPYLVWAAIGALMALPLIGFNNMMTHRGLWERTFLAVPTVWGKVDALFGITHNGPMGNLALWYVRTLLILFLLFPVWQGLGKLLSRWGWVWVGGGLALVCPDRVIPWVSVTWGAVGWFLLGMAVAAFGVGQRRLPRGVTAACVVVWLGLVVAAAGARVGCWAWVPAWVERGVPLMGILSMVGLYDALGCGAWPFPKVFRKTFWVYCLHGPVCGYVVAGGLFALGKSDVVSVSLAIVAPVAVTAVCLFAGVLAERSLPKAYAVLTGARG